jgi:hypothetical protein
MSIIPKLVALGLVAALSSPIPHHQTDYSTPGPDSHRINQLWVVTFVNKAGEEDVVQARLANGDLSPLIAADQAGLEDMMPVALVLAKASNAKIHLIKLTNRVDVQDIVP